MALTDSDRDVIKIFLEYYGDFNNWETNHWKNYHLLITAGCEEIADEYNSNNDDDESAYKKETQRLTLEKDKLFAIAKKMQHVEGLEPDEKFFLAKKLLDDGLNLMQVQIDNPPTFIRKKPVGRPSFKVLYRWLDSLVSELGSIQKAVNYVSDFPMIDLRNPNTLKREYRKYRKARGGVNHL